MSDSARWSGRPAADEPDPEGTVYQCLNNHPASSHNGACQVDGCPYGPNPPKPKDQKR